MDTRVPVESCYRQTLEREAEGGTPPLSSALVQLVVGRRGKTAWT